MAARIITYSTVNSTLGTSYTPNNYCASKKRAIQGGGDDVYGAGFANNRLITRVVHSIVTWTITFNKRVAGTDTYISEKTVNDGSIIGAPVLPTVSGYHFDHWEPSDPNSTTATANATFTAVYAADTVTTYHIKFLGFNDVVIDEYDLTPTQQIVTPTAPTVTNYEFKGWRPRNPNGEYPTKNETFKARYESVAPPHTGDPDQYFTITARTSGSINFNISTQCDATKVSYRISDGTQDAYEDYVFGNFVDTQLTPGTASTITVSGLQQGYIVQWKGNATHYGYGYGPGAYSYFSSADCQFDISNNLLTLLYDTSVENLTVDQKTKLDAQSDYCFVGLFAGCDKLINADDLYFPSNLIDGANTPEHHFTDMFRDCTNLQSAKFYISTGQLLDSAYERMFLGCSSLTVPPRLPSTQLGPHCYQAMFSGCTSLVTAPELPATNLVRGCYDSMFGEYTYSTYNRTYAGCTALNSITMKGTYYSPTNEPAGWKYTDSQYGTSVQHPLRNWVKFTNTSGTYVGQSSGNFYGDTGWAYVTTTGIDEYATTPVTGCDGVSYIGVPNGWTKHSI